MNLYLVRHGQSVDSAAGLHQRFDSPLSDQGRLQAQQIASRVKSLDVDKIISSPFARAFQTADIISNQLHLPVEINPLLSEMKRPTEILGQPRDNPQIIQIRHTIAENYTNLKYHYSDEENFLDLNTRATNLLKLIFQIDSANLLLVTHGVITRILFAVIVFGERLRPEQFMSLNKILVNNNTGLTHLQYSPEKNWKLITWNDQAHLG